MTSLLQFCAGFDSFSHYIGCYFHLFPTQDLNVCHKNIIPYNFPARTISFKLNFMHHFSIPPYPLAEHFEFLKQPVIIHLTSEKILKNIKWQTLWLMTSYHIQQILKGLRLTASSTGHLCNEDRFSRFIEMHSVQ